jgi:hypothetical protein
MGRLNKALRSVGYGRRDEAPGARRGDRGGGYGLFARRRIYKRLASRPGDLMARPSLARGVANLIDTVSVKHASGGTSMVQFKSYEQGREKFQGPGRELVWLDEEGRSRLTSSA